MQKCDRLFFVHKTGVVDIIYILDPLISNLTTKKLLNRAKHQNQFSEPVFLADSIVFYPLPNKHFKTIENNLMVGLFTQKIFAGLYLTVFINEILYRAASSRNPILFSAVYRLFDFRKKLRKINKKYPSTLLSVSIAFKRLVINFAFFCENVIRYSCFLFPIHFLGSRFFLFISAFEIFEKMLYLYSQSTYISCLICCVVFLCSTKFVHFLSTNSKFLNFKLKISTKELVLFSLIFFSIFLFAPYFFQEKVYFLAIWLSQFESFYFPTFFVYFFFTPLVYQWINEFSLQYFSQKRTTNYEPSCLTYSFKNLITLCLEGKKNDKNFDNPLKSLLRILIVLFYFVITVITSNAWLKVFSSPFDIYFLILFLLIIFVSFVFSLKISFFKKEQKRKQISLI